MEGMSNEMRNGLKLKLGDAMRVTPRNIQEVQASKLGDAQGIPFFINNLRSSFKTLYFYYLMHYLLFLERLCFQFSFAYFSTISWLDPNTLLLDRDTPRYSLPRSLQFSLLLFCECSLLLALLLALVFLCFQLRTFQFLFVDL